MFGNNLQSSGRSMKRLDNLCSLQTLNLYGTELNYKLSDILQSFFKCPHKALVSLQLSSNHVWGSIPDNIGAFSFLRVLELNENQLNGTINQSLGKLTMLEGLDLSSNSLNGTLTTAHLSNLSKLRSLYCSLTRKLWLTLVLIGSHHFKLDELFLKSCKIGPYFPRWITTQKHLSVLDISNASISDTIPISFWNSTLWSGIGYLDMSLNMINGTIPDVSITFYNFPQIKLGYNLLEGVIPSFLRNNVTVLFLSNNKLSKGLAPFLCPNTQTQFYYLDLSSNLFTEKLPDCWSYFDQLTNLHLENNSLWGGLPTSMGALTRLEGLHLSNNNLSGSLPASLVNCKSLIILDLANNSLIGHIPPDFGHSFGNLVILSLQNNRLVGVLPTSFCDLSYLQILDLSNNYISGTIPRCLHKLVSMANIEGDSSQLLADYLIQDYYDDASVIWKRNEQTFGYSYSLPSFGGNNSLPFLKGIDISNNKLEGHIPEGISSLLGLKFLNLSRNNLTGVIVSRIGQLASLESLDLSHNHLSGEIPLSLTQISYLSTFDISNNNLTGKIPIATQLQSFDASSYIGNPGLCGAPLPKCVGDEAPIIEPNGDGKQDTKDDFILGLCISVILGFIIGFWGVFGTLTLKRTWRCAVFRFYEDTKDRMCARRINIARAWRRS
ncbi:receptor-like protein EIX2 [Silene latifolia]|uniref:receptor-like protein EIX2 n=1 Tax=Silene latifolia TaxID=37657 RepID=UPI003D771421